MTWRRKPCRKRTAFPSEGAALDYVRRHDGDPLRPLTGAYWCSAHRGWHVTGRSDKPNPDGWTR